MSSETANNTKWVEECIRVLHTNQLAFASENARLNARQSALALENARLFANQSTLASENARLLANQSMIVSENARLTTKQNELDVENKRLHETLKYLNSLVFSLNVAMHPHNESPQLSPHPVSNEISEEVLPDMSLD